jgi:hypothetical protein
MATSFQQRFVARRRKTSVVPDVFAGRVAAEDNAVTITSLKVEQLLGMGDDATYRTMHTTPTVVLDPFEVGRCFDALTTGVPYACLQRLNAELTRTGLQFTSSAGELDAVGEMQTYINNVLVPLQQDALRAICAIGVVPIAFRRDEASGAAIPYVPAPKTYTIAVGSLRGQRYYMLHWLPADFGIALMREQQAGRRGRQPNDRLVAQRTLGDRLRGVPDSSVVVLHGFNNDPGVDGAICSLVASFLRSAVDPAHNFTTNALIAESINACPPIVRQYDGKLDEANHEALRDTEYVGQGVLDPTADDAARRINNRFLRNERQMAAYAMQTREARQQLITLAGDTVEKADAIRAEPVVREPHTATDARGNLMPWANELALPEQWRTATYHLPTPRHDLVPVLNHFNDQVFYAFLMPSQVLNANARLSADADMADRTLAVVVDQWRQSIGRVLTFATDSTFLQADVEAALAATIRRNRANAEAGRRDDLRLLVSDSELAEIVNTVATVRVSYRTKPPVKAADLERMYARGVIAWTHYAQTLAQINGIDPTVVNPEDRFPLEAQRLVGLPEYATYLQIEDARTHETNRHSEAAAMHRLERDAQRADEAATTDTEPEPAPVKKRRSARLKK